MAERLVETINGILKSVKGLQEKFESLGKENKELKENVDKLEKDLKEIYYRRNTYGYCRKHIYNYTKEEKSCPFCEKEEPKKDIDGHWCEKHGVVYTDSCFECDKELATEPNYIHYEGIVANEELPNSRTLEQHYNNLNNKPEWVFGKTEPPKCDCNEIPIDIKLKTHCQQEIENIKDSYDGYIPYGKWKSRKDNVSSQEVFQYGTMQGSMDTLYNIIKLIDGEKVWNRDLNDYVLESDIMTKEDADKVASDWVAYRKEHNIKNPCEGCGAYWEEPYCRSKKMPIIRVCSTFGSCERWDTNDPLLAGTNISKEQLIGTIPSKNSSEDIKINVSMDENLKGLESKLQTLDVMLGCLENVTILEQQKEIERLKTIFFKKRNEYNTLDSDYDALREEFFEFRLKLYKTIYPDSKDGKTTGVNKSIVIKGVEKLKSDIGYWLMIKNTITEQLDFGIEKGAKTTIEEILKGIKKVKTRIEELEAKNKEIQSELNGIYNLSPKEIKGNTTFERIYNYLEIINAKNKELEELFETEKKISDKTRHKCNKYVDLSKELESKLKEEQNVTGYWHNKFQQLHIAIMKIHPEFKGELYELEDALVFSQDLKKAVEEVKDKLKKREEDYQKILDENDANIKKFESDHKLVVEKNAKIEKLKTDFDAFQKTSINNIVEINETSKKTLQEKKNKIKELEETQLKLDLEYQQSIDSRMKHIESLSLETKNLQQLIGESAELHEDLTGKNKTLQEELEKSHDQLKINHADIKDLVNTNDKLKKQVIDKITKQLTPAQKRRLLNILDKIGKK